MIARDDTSGTIPWGLSYTPLVSDWIPVASSSTTITITYDYVQPYPPEDPAEYLEWKRAKAAEHARDQRVLFPKFWRCVGTKMKETFRRVLKTGRRTRETRGRSSVRQLALAGAY